MVLPSAGFRKSRNCRNLSACRCENFLTRVSSALEKRFWKHVHKTKTCWLWTASLKPSGHGQIRIKNKTCYAHRLSMQIHGLLVPGLVVDHVCRVPNCVNPAHLRMVTQRINAIENSDSAAALNARRKRCPLGHPLIVYGKRRLCRVCLLKQKKMAYLRWKKRNPGCFSWAKHTP